MGTINTQKITTALCMANSLVFLPKTVEEAIFIQERLFDLGCRWHRGKVVDEVQNCVDKGLVSEHGILLYNPVMSNPHLLCTSDQLGEKPLSSDQAFMLDLFNKLSLRLERMEQRLEGIEAELSPGDLGKPRHLKVPGGGAL